MRKNESRRKMKECLIEFLAERPISEIGVKDICEASGYHRSTFYDNYETIFELYRELHYDAFAAILEVVKVTYQKYALSMEGMVQVISLYEQSSLLRFLITIPGNAAFFDTYMMNYFQENLQLENVDFALRCKLRYRTVGGSVAIRYWLSQGKPCSKEELAKIILSS